MQWEYMEHKLFEMISNSKTLNMLGKDGWELTGVHAGKAYFKRPKVPEHGWREYEEWGCNALRAYGIDPNEIQVNEFAIQYAPGNYPILNATVWPYETPPPVPEDGLPLKISIRRTEDGCEVYIDDKTKVSHQRDWTQFEEGLKLNLCGDGDDVSELRDADPDEG